MNYFQIEAFLAIANTQSLSRAADALYVSQSTVSHRLKSLEEELNMTMVIRHKGHRTIELTPAGERFVSIAQRWKALWNDTIHLERSEPALSLNIGGVDSVSTYFLCPFYKEMKEKAPQLSLSFHLCNNSPQVYALLENREIDIGFVTVPAWKKNIVLEPILSESFKVLRYSPGGFVAASVNPAELETEYELFQPWGLEYQQWHDYWWPTPQKPHISFDATGMIRDFLDDERYWTIVPECIARRFETFSGFHSSNLIAPPPRHIGYMAVHRYPKDSSEAGIRLLEKHLRKYLAGHDLAYRNKA